MPIPSPDFGGIKTGEFHERVLKEQGTIVPNIAPPIIDKLQRENKWEPSLLIIPAAYKEGILFSQVPTDGSCDFTVVRNTVRTGINSNYEIESFPENYPVITYVNGIPCVDVNDDDDISISFVQDILTLQIVRSDNTIETVAATSPFKLPTGRIKMIIGKMGEWILAEGVWNDDGIWADNKTWID